MYYRATEKTDYVTRINQDTTEVFRRRKYHIIFTPILNKPPLTVHRLALG